MAYVCWVLVLHYRCYALLRLLHARYGMLKPAGGAVQLGACFELAGPGGEGLAPPLASTHPALAPVP